MEWGKENRKIRWGVQTWQVHGRYVLLTNRPCWNMQSNFLFCKTNTLIPGSPFSRSPTERPVLSWLHGWTGVKLLLSIGDETWRSMWGGTEVLFSRGWKPRLDLPNSASRSFLLRAFTPLRRALLHRFLSLLERNEGITCFFFLF